MTNEEIQRHLKEVTKYSKLYLKIIENSKSKGRVLRKKNIKTMNISKLIIFYPKVYFQSLNPLKITIGTKSY